MQVEHSSLLGHGSFTEALLNHDSLDYSEWCTNFLSSNHHSHLPFVHTTLPSMINNCSQTPTHFYTEQGLARLVQQQYNDIKDPTLLLQYPPTSQQQSQQQHLAGTTTPCLPTTLPLPVSTAVQALPPSGSPIALPPFLSNPLPHPILHTKSISIPEFTYTPNGLDSPTDSAIWQLPEPLHRNYYHTIQFRVPSAAYATTPGLYGSYESYRVYIHPELGYSGNAKRFKQAPEVGEKAFMLEGTVLDSSLRPITQCAACEEYFENKSYFVANPHCKGRILLIKNNQVNRIKNNIFSLNLKPMCCSRHHQSPFYLHFVLRDTVNFRVVMSTIFMSHVKQWKKTSATPSKRRKTAHDSPISSGSSSPSSSPSSSAATSPDISLSGSSTHQELC